MKKSDLANITLELWAHVDQADYDLAIKEAFANMPIGWQKEFIKRMIENGFEREPDDGILKKAQRLTGLEE